MISSNNSWQFLNSNYPLKNLRTFTIVIKGLYICPPHLTTNALKVYQKALHNAASQTLRSQDLPQSRGFIQGAINGEENASQICLLKGKGLGGIYRIKLRCGERER